MLTFKTSRNRFYDKAHRSVVSVLMAMTVVGFGFVGYSFYDWWYVYRPQVKDALNKELLEEGKSDFDDYSDITKEAPLDGQSSSK